MHIESIFAKDVTRSINGVIKADQRDKAYNELEEYVITKEVDRHLRRFVDAFLQGLENKNDAEISTRMGVWVSGFFGSGKSHFIKILSYLLANDAVVEDGKPERLPLDFFIEKVSGDSAFQGDLSRMANAQSEVILFNIDSKAEQNHSRDAILQVFLKVFNEHLGYCGDHPEVAHMERFLDGRGKFQEFIDVLAADHNLDWRAERDSYQFYGSEVAAALSKVLSQRIDNPQAWIDNLDKGLSLTIENFAKWVRQYLDRSGGAKRLVFLADEVGQFIGGQSQLMLNLQTITENLGTICDGHAWVVVTSQEDIEAVVGGAFEKDRSKDFSKIQGRFATRLSLSGANADEVIQRRLLEKTPAAQEALKALFGEKGDILRNQITFRDSGITLRSFSDADGFAECYPFAPYQFLLVQKIFEASRQFGATGGHLSKGERSMLDAFQTAAKAIKDRPLGALVPLDAFYPAIESFLEGVVRTAIGRVENIADRSDFDARLLKTLFLIRYVEEVPANIDNLVTFFVDEVDADKRALRSEIEQSLLRLERETLISRNGDLYFFLTNEERDINKEIKDQDFSHADLNRLLGDVIFEDVLRDRRYRHATNGKDFDLTRLIDLTPFGNRVEGSLILSFLTPLAPDFSTFNDARCIELSMGGSIGQVVVKLRDDKKLSDEIIAYIKTEAYLRLKSDGSLPQTTKRIHDDKRLENSQRRNRINTSLSQMLEEAKFFVLGNEKSFPGTPKVAVYAALRYLVENSYNKLSFIQHSPTDQLAELRRVLADPSGEELDLLGGSQNARALKEVLEYVELLSGRSQSVNLGSLITERFARHPYGWKELDTLLLVCRLFKAGQIELHANGGKLQASDVYAQIDGSNKWNRVSLSRRKTVDKADIQSVRVMARDLFGAAAPEGEDDLHNWLRDRFAKQSQLLAQWSGLAATGAYPGSDEIADLQGMLNKLLANRDSFGFLGHAKAHAVDLGDYGERFQRLETFYTQQKPQWEALRSAFRGEFEPNAFFLNRDPEAAAALSTVRSILNDPRPYGRIRESAPLIQTLRDRNETVIAERRAEALAKVDPQIETLRLDLTGIGVDADFSNKCLKPIQDIRKQIEFETNTGQISNLIEEAAEAAKLAHSDIEKVVEAAKRASATPPPTEPSIVKQPGATPVAPAPKVSAPENFKPRRQISTRLPASKPYLETREDVDEYLAALRRQLEEAIASNVRIEIL
ncbi:BREX system P-loop protein BrxC [Gluconobacter sp. Dm-73]|uniref:BREX system P-loop protein BrxC n=1 Tax=Gluconobacter sp. Dm-73 TaxID=2799802 RepID=UPI001B8B4E7B|nr:BREX system P-loop protein BrxC [Gluconobacter sp. Dm-73]MBS1073672.1 BREX system P-loop protein BrxC [Gluconobacter sp. Dm-73]